MDLGDDHALQLFLEVYGTLPRAGPGGDDHTARAVACVPGPTPRTVLDLGCGPGAQTVSLARALPDARILAVDVLPAMAERTRRRIDGARLDDRVRVVIGDMATPPVSPRSQDLIWCEGAIYHLGVTDALRRWRPLLSPGGTVAFTQPVWLVDTPPDEVRDWWLSEYPDLTDDEGTRAQIEAAGYRTISTFRLPPSAWWDDYYAPMEARIEALRTRLPDDPTAREIVASAETEIDTFRRFGDAYTYAFYVVQDAQRS